MFEYARVCVCVCVSVCAKLVRIPCVLSRVADCVVVFFFLALVEERRIWSSVRHLHVYLRVLFSSCAHGLKNETAL